MRRKSLSLVISVTALVALGSFSGTAFAASPERTSTPFTASYTDPLVGPVTCAGRHETNSKMFPGTETSGGRDTETCKSSVKKTPLTLVSPDETGGYTSPTGTDEAGVFATRTGRICENGSFQGWNSDYAPLNGKRATSYTYTVSANGKSYKLVAYYPAA
jgi:hypothetical protein